MFNEKKIHYLIVAALATSVSTDAFASTRNDVDDSKTRVEVSEFEKGTPTRASSRTFSESTNLDTVRWNDDLVAVLPMLPQLEGKKAPSDCCQHAASGAMCISAKGDVSGEQCPSHSALSEIAESRSNRIDLGDGRMFELESIRFDDGDFATTLVGSRSMSPIAVPVEEDLSRNFNRLDFSPNSDNHRWSYVGRLIDTRASQAERYVEGELPMKIQYASGTLSVQIDSKALINSLT